MPRRSRWPLDAEAADLVVWREQGFYPQEDEAVSQLAAISGNWRHQLVNGELVWAKGIHRIVTDGMMHYLDFSAERMLPPMQKLLDQPFWLDPSDPHPMAAVMQIASRPLARNYAVASGNWRHDLVEQQYLWQKAINRVLTENVSPEHAVDDAITRIKQILSE